MTDSVKHYVLGFVFDQSLEHVILIRKSHPEWQAGKLNGVGGKIEEGETSEYAMMRECLEETGIPVLVYEWHPVFQLIDKDACSDYSMMVYTSRLPEDRFRHPIRREDEQANWYGCHALHFEYTLPNLSWMIPLARDWYRSPFDAFLMRETRANPCPAT